MAASSLASVRWTRGLLSIALYAALFRSGPDLADVAAHVRTPIFIVSGGADRVCPPEMARNLAGRAGCQLLEIAEARHVGQRSEEQGQRAHDAIVTFLDGVLARIPLPGA